MSDSYLEVQLDQQPIELCKLLKIADLVTGGGEAKVVISEGYVLLNGEVEYQKRKKVYHNDIVEFNGETLKVVVDENLANNTDESVQNDPLPPVKNKEKYSSNNKPKKPVPKNEVILNEETANKRKRKSISF